MIILVLNIGFWVWCGLLAVLAVLFFITASGLSAEAGGAGAVLLGAAATVLLVISLLLRLLVWWL